MVNRERESENERGFDKEPDVQILKIWAGTSGIEVV